MNAPTHGADLFEDGYPHGTVEGFNDGCRGGACPGTLEYGLSCKRAHELAAGDFRYSRLAAAGKTPAEIAYAIDGTGPLVDAPEPVVYTTETPVEDAAQPLAERAQDSDPQEDAGDPAIEEEAPAAGTPDVEDEAMGHHVDVVEDPKPAAKPKRDKYPHGTEAGYARGCTNASACPGHRITQISCATAHLIAQNEQPKPAKPKKPAAAKKPAVARAPKEKPLSAVMREWAIANGHEVPARGTLRRSVIEAYQAAHQLEATDEGAVNGVVIDADEVTGNSYTDVLDETRKRLAAAPDPVADPPSDAERRAAIADEIERALETDERVLAWDEIARHPLFADCYQSDGALIDAIRQKLDTLQALAGADNRPQVLAGPYEPAPVTQILDDPDAANWPDLTNTIPARPDWGVVAESIDVERARRIAVRLEQELAQLEEKYEQLGPVEAENVILRHRITEAEVTAGIFAGLYRSAERDLAMKDRELEAVTRRRWWQWRW